MFKYITQAVLYDSCGCELDRRTLNENNMDLSLYFILRDWSINEGNTIKIESHLMLCSRGGYPCV